jgi:hypothetical protein
MKDLWVYRAAAHAISINEDINGGRKRAGVKGSLNLILTDSEPHSNVSAPKVGALGEPRLAGNAQNAARVRLWQDPCQESQRCNGV